jgi:hypothetical protein
MSGPITTFNESPLHAGLKAWYAGPGDRLEVAVDGYVVDVVQGGRLIEIQTGNFAAIKPKLLALTQGHPVRLAYPIAREKWIVRLDPEGPGQLGRRKSPRRGAVEDVFAELVSFPRLLAHPNFSLEVLSIQEEEVRRHDGLRRWRNRGWVTHERRLLKVLDRRLFETPADLAALLPAALPQPFTTADLARALGRPRRLAQRMAYCLREMGVLQVEGKRRNAMLYTPAPDKKRPGP